MHSRLRHSAALLAFCFLFALPSLAFGADPILTNGSDGSYWGLSQAEVAAKAPGTFKKEEEMAGFVILVYTGAVNGVPVETFYSLKGDKCWKAGIDISGDREDILPLFDAVVAALTKTMGEPEEKSEVEDIIKSVSWEGGETTASLYYIFKDGKAKLSIAYESKALAKVIWGKLAG